MADDAPLRSAQRLLQLLRLMNTQPVWTLHALHLASGLPKPTLSRLLATLQAEGYARPELPAGTWRLQSTVEALSAGIGEGHRLVDRGRALLLSVTRQIKWPLAIGVLDVDAIAVRFSSMPYSPLAAHTTTLGHRLPLDRSAMGRAFLAHCAPRVREALLPALREAQSRSAEGGLDKARLDDALQADLQQVRACGHAVRQPGPERQTATLAVPVLQGGEAVAVLGMTTFGKSLTAAVIARHAPVLRDAAARLVEAATDGPESRQD